MPNLPQTGQQAESTKKALNLSGIIGGIGAGMDAISLIFGILVVLEVVGCATNTCPDFDAAGVWNPRALPTTCVEAACQELDYPKKGWQQDEDCAASFSTAQKNMKCDSGYNLYVSEHIVFGDPRAGWCAPRTCCSTSGTPPSGFVKADGFTCPAADDASNYCGLKQVCIAFQPFVFGSLAFGFVLLALYIVSAVMIRIAAKERGAKLDGPAI